MFKDIKKKAKAKATQIKDVTTSVGSKVADQAKNLGESASDLATGAVKTATYTASSAGKIARGVTDSVVIALATKIVIRSMKKVGKRGSSYINDDSKYEMFVDSTWEMLPLPVRLIGRDTLGYDTAMFTLRDTVFSKDDNEPEIGKNDEGIIKKTIKGMFQ